MPSIVHLWAVVETHSGLEAKSLSLSIYMYMYMFLANYKCVFNFICIYILYIWGFGLRDLDLIQGFVELRA